FTIKSAQNIDLPAHSLTPSEGGIHPQQGTRYHFHHVYDAQQGTVTTVVSAGGTVLKTLTYAASASNHTLTVPTTGLVAEFGDYADEPGPAVPAYGWSYYDLRVEMVPY